ncbi:MAG TPA: ornithine cyclodeaminase family protein [Gammaproteobacteria bacterium]|nr:ornithine cyclodeaminase family protein [Gammaproteobacteria bacterium]
MLILDRGQVESLLNMDALIEALAPAMVELSAGRISMPQRMAAQVEGKGLLGVMPAYLPASGTLSCKLVSVFPGNGAASLPTHQAVVMLFDATSGTPLAMLDGSSITALRTAAGSALATRLLAREDAKVLLIIGTGVQALAHARAVRRVRGISEFRVVGRDPLRLKAFVEALVTEFHCPVKAVAPGARAFVGVDIVCATTHAEQPVVRGEWLLPGMHVNSVGLNAKGQELDVEVVQRAKLVVESRAAALAPPPAGANELAGAIVHAEIGEIVSGARPGRIAPDEVTLYKSVGVAIQDAVAARLVYDAALAQGLGRDVSL